MDKNSYLLEKDWIFQCKYYFVYDSIE